MDGVKHTPHDLPTYTFAIRLQGWTSVSGSDLHSSNYPSQARQAVFMPPRMHSIPLLGVGGGARA